eukprot:Colp12_sorted_trinity150504_noHs@22934
MEFIKSFMCDRFGVGLHCVKGVLTAQQIAHCPSTLQSLTCPYKDNWLCNNLCKQGEAAGFSWSGVFLYIIAIFSTCVVLLHFIKQHNDRKETTEPNQTRKPSQGTIESRSGFLRCLIGAVDATCSEGGLNVDPTNTLEEEHFKQSHTHEWFVSELGAVHFVNHAPQAFRHIRAHFGVTDDVFRVSLQLLKDSGKSQGKSGQRFYLSTDRKLVLKTLSKSEARFLLQLLPDYVIYCNKQPYTLLPHFYGMYTIRAAEEKNDVFIVAMNNVFDSPLQVQERYDLKGSTIGRFVPDEAKQDADVTLKDMDLCSLSKRIHLGRQRKIAFVLQIERDCEFLKEHE